VRIQSSLLARFGLFTALSLSALGAGAAEPTAAPESAPAVRRQAAHAYDRGVSEFDRADYAAAARSFLEADALVQNDDAIANALSAAQRARDPSLTREAAERVLERKTSNAALVARARAALAESQAEPGAAPVDESVTITPAAPASAKPAPAAANEAAAEDGGQAGTDGETSSARPLSPSVFFVGAGVTAALAGITIWSGVDTLAARDRLPGTQADNDAVMARAHRTDALLVGTLVVGAVTAFAGLRWVEWDKPAESVAVRASLAPGSAALYVAGPLP
jgi:hypothetical protein